MNTNYYDSIAKSYDRLHKEEQTRKLKAILPHLTVHPYSTFVDVGCGTGVALPHFKTAIKIGCDPARQLLLQGPKLAPFVNAAGEALPIRSGCADIVLCLTAFHNFSDHNRGIEEMKRIAAPNATIVITILKKIAKAAFLGDLIRANFDVVKELDDHHDTIYICKQRQS